MLGGNLSLAALLTARWVESGHFPLSNMYESLLFLAWGITVRGGGWGRGDGNGGRGLRVRMSYYDFVFLYDIIAKPPLREIRFVLA